MFAGLDGVFDGIKGHVMDTVVRDPGVVLHRYKERMDNLTASGKPYPIDSAWSAMVKLNYERQEATAEDRSTEGSLTKSQFKELL